jgi:hypothetical protein
MKFKDYTDLFMFVNEQTQEIKKRIEESGMDNEVDILVVVSCQKEGSEKGQAYIEISDNDVEVVADMLELVVDAIDSDESSRIDFTNFDKLDIN